MRTAQTSSAIDASFCSWISRGTGCVIWKHGKPKVHNLVDMQRTGMTFGAPKSYTFFRDTDSLDQPPFSLYRQQEA
jgi:hypothetical protein